MHTTKCIGSNISITCRIGHRRNILTTKLLYLQIESSNDRHVILTQYPDLLLHRGQSLDKSHTSVERVYDVSASTTQGSNPAYNAVEQRLPCWTTVVAINCSWIPEILRNDLGAPCHFWDLSGAQLKPCFCLRAKVVVMIQKYYVLPTSKLHQQLPHFVRNLRRVSRWLPLGQCTRICRPYHRVDHIHCYSSVKKRLLVLWSRYEHHITDSQLNNTERLSNHP